MRDSLNRRSFLYAGGSALAFACARHSEPRVGDSAARDSGDALLLLEAKLGGRVGVFALDVDSGRSVAHRADERFAMASTFKLALAAAVLERVDRGELTLSQLVPYGAGDLLEYAPTARENVARGALSVEELACAAVTLSDNTAANLLLGLIEGPAGLTRFFRQLGDTFTRLDRSEPLLNTNLPGDPRDTTLPRAMVADMRQMLTGSLLTAPSRERLLGWLEACHTGAQRLRAGLPVSWRTGDKTGSGRNGAINDLAITWPPTRGPILIASYLSESRAALPALQAAHAEIGRLVAARLGAHA